MDRDATVEVAGPPQVTERTLVEAVDGTERAERAGRGGGDVLVPPEVYVSPLPVLVLRMVVTRPPRTMSNSWRPLSISIPVPPIRDCTVVPAWRARRVAGP